MLTSLEQREVFHIAFLRQFAKVIKPGTYALKGGTNFRLFFGSTRYSEDMDIDVKRIEVYRLKNVAMEILASKTLSISLRSFGIDQIVPPDVKSAKQTETTQRFKVHLITSASENLFTKIEFSRRGFDPSAVTEAIDMVVLRTYKLPPLLVSHYPVSVAAVQKIHALASRTQTQARDAFDLYLLLPRLFDAKPGPIPQNILKKACDRLFEISFEMFRDSVLNYLKDEDCRMYNQKNAWEEIQIKVGEFLSRRTK